MLLAALVLFTLASLFCMLGEVGQKRVFTGFFTFTGLFCAVATVFSLYCEYVLVFYTKENKDEWWWNRINNYVHVEEHKEVQEEVKMEPRGLVYLEPITKRVRYAAEVIVDTPMPAISVKPPQKKQWKARPQKKPATSL